MSESLLPKKTDTSESPFQRFGLLGRYSLLLPISTSVSEGGIGHAAGLDFELAENFSERFSIGLEFDYLDTKGKLFPTTGESGTGFDRSQWALLGGMGRTSRLLPYFNDEGDLGGSFALRTASYIGGGSAKMSGGTTELDGEKFDLGGKEKSFAAAKQSYGLFYDIGLGNRGLLSIGPELEIGAQHAGAGSEFNRMTLGLMLTVRIGYGDASCLPGGTLDTELGAMGIAYGFYSIAQAYGQRFMINSALADAQEELGGYLSTEGSDRGSMADLPLLQSASALAGAAGSGSLSTALRAGDWYWAFLAAQAAGAGFLASEGTAGKASGISDLLGAARLSGYALAGIHSPEKRLALSNDEVRRREMYISLASWLASAALFTGGALGNSEMIMNAGAGGSLAVSFTPGPLERGLTESMSVSLIPASYVGGNEKSGVRSGLRIHNSWNDFPHPDFQLFTSVFFLSPLLGNRELNSDVDAAMGMEWKTRYSRVYGGLDIKGIFGGSEGEKGGIGGIFGVDGIIPVSKKFNITVGAHGMFHYILPAKKPQYEVGGSIGFEFSVGK